MAKNYLSNRQKRVNIGIVSYTENETVLSVAAGKVGIGTEDAVHSLHVQGTSALIGNVGINTFNPSEALWVDGLSLIHI